MSASRAWASARSLAASRRAAAPCAESSNATSAHTTATRTSEASTSMKPRARAIMERFRIGEPPRYQEADAARAPKSKSDRRRLTRGADLDRGMLGACALAHLRGIGEVPAFGAGDRVPVDPRRVAPVAASHEAAHDGRAALGDRRVLRIAAPLAVELLALLGGMEERAQLLHLRGPAGGGDEERCREKGRLQPRGSPS